MAGAAPKCPATGSQSLEVKKENPNVRSAGHAATPTATKMRRSNIGTRAAKPVMDQE